MTVKLPATVTFDEAGAVLHTLQQAVNDASGSLEVDASALTELDSGALALLLQARRLAAARGLAFELHSPPDKLLALARLYGVEPLLGVTPAVAPPAAASATSPAAAGAA